MRYLLLPLSLIYGFVIVIRNILFDIGILKSRHFEIPVICIGNITVGGTGKTPHTEFVTQMLKPFYRIAVLSRGYKRKTKGFIIAHENAKSKQIGDEPKQIKNKFPDICVAVDEKRVEGIELLQNTTFNPNLIILDDAFQHRYVKPALNILLIDYNQPPQKDFLLPAGRLREYMAAQKRAHIIIITKCPPNLQPIEKRIITSNIRLLPFQNIFFTTLQYKHALPVFSTKQDVYYPEIENFAGMDILLVTAIAQPRLLSNYVRSTAASVEHFNYSDHYDFKRNDIYQIVNQFNKIKSNHKIILTTEKDAIRLREAPDIVPLLDIPLYYLPVEVEFLFEETKLFNQIVNDYISKNESIVSIINNVKNG